MQCQQILHPTAAFYLAVINLSISMYLYKTFPAPPPKKELPVEISPVADAIELNEEAESAK